MHIYKREKFNIMTANINDISNKLEESINRLEEARNTLLMIMESFGTDIISNDFDSNIENLEGSLFETESRLDEVAQLLGEEIDNLRGIHEKLEED